MARKKKIDLKRQSEEFKESMLLAFDKYVAARKALSIHEGKLIDDVGLDKVNSMIKDIQSSFLELYPAINFIHSYSKFSLDLLKRYDDFIEGLKKQGGIESKG